MECKCGFKFSGAGEFRNCEAFIASGGQGGVICPKCGRKYVGETEVKITMKGRNDGRNKTKRKRTFR